MFQFRNIPRVEIDVQRHVEKNPSRKPEVDGGQGYCVARVNNESERSSGRTQNNAIVWHINGVEMRTNES